MKGKSSTIVLSIVAIGIFLVAGCASTKKAVKGPDWIWKGGGAFDIERGQVFYGVGSASGIKNRALMRDTADNRARKDIALTLEAYVAHLAKDYMASTTAGDMSATAEEQHVEEALKTFTKATLHGAVIVDRWYDKGDNTMYSLCELDILAFKDTLDNYNELNSKVRDYVRKNAERLHQELKELEDQQ